MTKAGKNLEPLYYAIVRHFMTGEEDCAEGVIDALKSDYGTYKLLTYKGVEEALTTAKENGILDECRFDLDEKGRLVVYYQITEFGSDMIRAYIG